MSIVVTQYGKMRIIDADKVVSHALGLYGEWAMDELDLLGQIISPGMRVLDVGAFIGTHSLAFSQFVGEKGRVYAFEPRKEIYAILSENLLLNNCENVTALNIGLAEIEKDLVLQSIDLNEMVNFGGLSIDAEVTLLNSATYKIHVSTIDGLGIGKIDVIKLDVEGMERSVLDGATETILRDRPIVFCECNSLSSGNEVLTFCQAREYDTYGFLASAYNPNNFNAITENIFGMAKELALLLVPRENTAKIISAISDTLLFPIRNIEDLVLPLLHKPQYAYEVLANTSTSLPLGINFPSPAAVGQDEKIVSLSQGIVQRDQMITSRSRELEERNEVIVGLSETITGLQQMKERREEDIARLQQIVIDRNAYIQKLVNSTSWFITKPIRFAGRLIRGDFVAAMTSIKSALNVSSTITQASPNGGLKLEKTSSYLVTASPIAPTHPVAVILPVYRGVEMTRRCIDAAIPNILSNPGARIVAINDASPDAGMQEMLEELGKKWPDVFVVLKNESNLGFVRTVNRGFAHFPQHDVVLLNSDVIVPKDWLSRLIDEGYSRKNIATVTPFSNNATICSFPYFLQENPQPFGLDVDSVDAVFRQAKLPCIEAPTGVGFCMYIRRECLDTIGYLNEEKFGRGYGEENDLCQRALKSGWLNIISPNLYAYHEGGVSFSSEKHALVTRAMGVIEDLHPSYHSDIELFVKNDPLRSARVARYVQLLSTLPIPKVLHISHAVGGGVAQHVNELAQYFGQSVAHVLLAPHVEEGEISISLGIDQHADKVIFSLPSGYKDVVSLLKAIGVSAIHYHHTQGLDPSVLRLPVDLNVASILTAHDFYWLNANPTLTNESGRYPGFYSDKLRNPLYPLPPGETLETWQERFRPLIETAQCVIFPSSATKSLFENVYHIETGIIAPHVEMQLDVNRIPSIFTKRDSYTIGVIGAVGREKGADILEEMAEKAKILGLPLRFKLIGYAYRLLKVVDTTGPYDVNDLGELMREHALDIVLFPAQWPETYSYTLSHALNSGLPIIAPSIGAFPERLSGRSNTLLFNHLSSPNELLDQFNAFIENLSKGVSVVAPIFEGVSSKTDFYDLEYKQLISCDLKVIKSDQTAPIIFHAAQILSGSSHNKSTWRGSVLGALWYLYTHPLMRRVSSAVPYKMRRSIKRSLSRSALHDINKFK